MNKNILVTGGAGFIGSHFIKRISKSSFNQIVCVDKLTYAGNMKNLESGISRRYDFFQEDINNILMKQIIKDFEIDIVVNFAAETHVDRSIKDPKAFLETDVMGLFNLVQCCIKQKIKKFVHVSTDEVYGSIEEYDEEDPLSRVVKFTEAYENFPLNPTSPYSGSKACADLLLLSYYKTYGFPVVIARPCNNYGPNQYPEKLIPMAITRLIQGKKVLMHGEGKEVREWLYVGDCVRILERIMNDGKVGEIYNVGSGYRMTNEGIIKKVIEYITGVNDFLSDPYYDYIEKVSNRPGNDSRYAINSEKIKEAFRDGIGRVPFSIGLQETIEWYRANKDHFGEVNLDDNLHIEGEGYLR